MACGYASELFVSSVHYSAGLVSDDNSKESILGQVPSHIRGNLSDFELNLV
jgi:hypothetical protein